MFLYNFSFSNFFSFNGEQSVSLEVSENAPDTSAYMISDGGRRVTKVLAVYGANGSGKTNLLKVLGFMRWFICHSFQSDPDEKMPYEPFLFQDEIPFSSINVEFDIEGIEYRYKTIFSEERVIFEGLSYRKREDSSRFRRLFRREWNSREETYSFISTGIDLIKDFGASVRGNSSVISTAVQYNNAICLSIWKAWQSVVTNFVQMGHISVIAPDLSQAAKFFHENPEYVTRATTLLTSFDLGLAGFHIEEQKINRSPKEDIPYYMPHGVHRFEQADKEYVLPLFYESSGVQKLFCYLASLLPTLSNGGVVVMDDFDVDLHPYMVEKILDFFLSPETNPKNAQLIFSCHYAPLLQLLDKYQIQLAEKNDQGESEVWRLDEMKGIRADDNYFAKYITGAYGAVPQL